MTGPVADDPDRCSAPFRVRFDEAGPDGLLRTSSPAALRPGPGLVSTPPSAGSTGPGTPSAASSGWPGPRRSPCFEPVRVGDELTGTTQVVGSRRVWARRRTEFTDRTARSSAWTHVDWVLLDGRGAPTRIPPEFDGAFGPPGGDLPAGSGGPRRRRRRTPRRPRFAVRPQELDPMDHANNAVYADWLEERGHRTRRRGRDRGDARPARDSHGSSTPGPPSPGTTIEARDVAGIGRRLVVPAHGRRRGRPAPRPDRSGRA